MVCRAIIEAKLSKYKLKVRIPSIHKGVQSIGATPTVAIPEATISVPAGIYPSLKVNDVVLVGFEDDDIDKPVVLGLLYCDDAYNISSDVQTDSLKVKVNTQLSKDTQIGEVTGTNIQQLKGIKNNIQKQIDDANKDIKKIFDEGCGELMPLLTALDTLLDQLLD